jgi:hypothetical protein
MITVQAEVDESLVELIGKIRQFQQNFPMVVLFPSAAAAVKGAAYAIEAQWKAFASGEPLPSGDRVKSSSGGYAASIKTRQEGVWHYVTSSKAAVARWLEEGTAELDMKETHPYGPRGRVAKKKIPKRLGGGFRYVPYLIVPIRWATPGAGAHMGAKNVIPDQIYKALIAKDKNKQPKFKRSVVLNEKTASPNFWGEQQQRATYAWGDRLTGEGGNIEGLVAMAGAEKKGGRRESTYFTFRVISADSPAGSWVRPAQKALRIAEQTAAFMKEKVNKMVGDGFAADVERLKP